jgi:TPR repeat protein
VLTAAQSYYRVAANLGDADAQQDLAFCLANGKGCKKDKKEAAKWYRAAVSTASIIVARHQLILIYRSDRVPVTLGWRGSIRTNTRASKGCTPQLENRATMRFVSILFKRHLLLHPQCMGVSLEMT